MPLVKVAACQLPAVRENVEAALSWIDHYARRAARRGVRLLCFPECFLQGYLVEEESARKHAVELTSAEFTTVLRRLAHVEPILVFGMIEACAGSLFNTAVVVKRGELLGWYRKCHLLAGERLFSAGTSFPVFEANGLKFGVNICSDTQDKAPACAVASNGAELIVCPANNMMRRASAERWKDQHNQTRAMRAKESGCWLVSADVTGEQDGSIALGPTAVINPTGCVVAQVPLMEIGMVVADIPCKGPSRLPLTGTARDA